MHSTNIQVQGDEIISTLDGFDLYNQMLFLSYGCDNFLYIPVANSIPAQCVDDVHCNDWTPAPDSAPALFGFGMRQM